MTEWIGKYAVVSRVGDSQVGWGPFATPDEARAWAAENAPDADMILIKLLPARDSERG